MSNSENKSFFVNEELQILKFWQDNHIFEKSLDATKNNKPYLFYDGPPFATGLPHNGHLLACIIKDIIPRYFTMKGRYVDRRFGWDCHGVPIEHEIDKKLGMPTSVAVKELGIKGYNDECRQIVNRYTKEWEKTVTRIGRWVDFKNDYKTMDTSYMESVWWVFSKLWEKGLVYQGVKVVPYSVGLQTVLSNFEASSNYQDVQDPAITILFKSTDEDLYYAAWTTTPWTLVSNLALCVHPKFNYVKVKERTTNRYIVMAEDRLSYYNSQDAFEIVDKFLGKTLQGKKYTPLFPYFANLAAKGAFQILTDDYVSSDDGTGIVHIAPSFGEDDFRIVKDAGLNLSACPLDEKGCFTKTVSDYQGIFVKDADKGIITKLKEQKSLLNQSVIVHSYPFCPRSDTPLIYLEIPSWYINVTAIKDDLINANKKITWVPEHIKEGRFGKWIAGAKDWAVSRNRVWGTPLPIWINDKTKKAICIGSIKQLEQLSGVKTTDLHREYVDNITFKIDGEDGTYKRINEVLDCWFESGSMPYAQLHYPFENQEVFSNGFPAEFIAEGLDQTRGWFYTLNVLSSALFNSPAFTNVIVNGIVVAADGKKMSKRLKNYTPPDELLGQHGADALRLYLITSGLVKGEEQRFSDDGVVDMIRRALLPWYNSFKFLITYTSYDNWKSDPNFKTTNILDNWIISKLQTLKKNVATEMEAYHLYTVVPELFAFIDDLTNTYIRLNRSRFWGDPSTDKNAAYNTLYLILKELSQVMAPFAPFLSEHIYQELKTLDDTTKLSVHLTSYPTADLSKIDDKLEEAVKLMQEVILLARQKRNQEQIKLKIPLSSLTIIHRDPQILKQLQNLKIYLSTELNVKKIEFNQNETDYIKFYALPNSPILGKRLGKDFPKYNKIIRGLSSNQLQQFISSKKIELDGITFNTEEILVHKEALPNSNITTNEHISILLDTQLTSDLIDEGLARELIGHIQKLRKDSNFNIIDRINIYYHGDSKLCQVLENYASYIKGETLAINMTRSNKPQQLLVTIDEFNISFTIEVV